MIRYAVVFLLAACTTGSDSSREQPAKASAPPTGATLHYTRSNWDGSHPERILVHIASPTELAVAKMVGPCTDAALVTGEFDADTGEALWLTGGRLGRDGAQVPQLYLTPAHDAASGKRLDIRFGDPAGPVQFSLPAPPSPWRIYDFDFAEFALFGPRKAADFSFGLAMTWPDEDDPGFLSLGETTASYSGTEPNGQRMVHAYSVGGPAFGEKGGVLKLDAAAGYVVEARLGRPNHPGYENYLLKLDRVIEGEAAWREAIAAHWRGCPG